MIITVSDTNVFVALFRCNLLFTVFSNSRVKIVIPTEIYNELTSSPHRIIREHPQLAQLIRTLIHNPSHGYSITLSVFNYRSDPMDVPALAAHFALDEQANLDKGEREAIPVAIQLSATFVSCDSDAVLEFSSIKEKNGASCFHFLAYCEDLEKKGVISLNELTDIRRTISE